MSVFKIDFDVGSRGANLCCNKNTVSGDNMYVFDGLYVKKLDSMVSSYIHFYIFLDVWGILLSNINVFLVSVTRFSKMYHIKTDIQPVEQ